MQKPTATPKSQPKDIDQLCSLVLQSFHPLRMLNHYHRQVHGFCFGFSSHVYGDDGGGDVHDARLQEVVHSLDTNHPGVGHTAAGHIAAPPACEPCDPCIYAPPRSLQWLPRLRLLNYQVTRLPFCVRRNRQLLLLPASLQDPSHRLGLVRRNRSLVGRSG